MLQYNPSNNTWTQIGSLKDTRAWHAVAEVNLAALGCVGNLNPIEITITITININIIIIIIITQPWPDFGRQGLVESSGGYTSHKSLDGIVAGIQLHTSCLAPAELGSVEGCKNWCKNSNFLTFQSFSKSVWKQQKRQNPLNMESVPTFKSSSSSQTTFN